MDSLGNPLPSLPRKNLSCHPFRMVRLAILCGTMGLIVGCSGDDVVVLTLPPTDRGMAAEIAGTLGSSDEGCLLIGDNLAVWPSGTRWIDGQLVISPQVAYSLGDAIRGAGGEVPSSTVSDMLDEASRSKWKDCKSSSDQVTIFVQDLARSGGP